MSDKKILIITRNFPPYSGRGSVMRMLKFAKYLPEFGWQPFVIAEKKDKVEDSSLLQQLPSSVGIKYVYSQTPQKRKNEYKRQLKGKTNLSYGQKIKYLFYRSVGYNVYALYQNYLMAPDLGLFWAKEAFAAALELHNKQQFNVFLTSGPPFSTFRVGLDLKNKLGVPWVLDFRDGWVGNPIFDTTGKKFINLQNSKLEKEAIGKASLSIFATDPMCRIYEERYPAQHQNMITITNGFDPEDYANIEPKQTGNAKLHFIYSGTISGKQVPTTFLNGLLKAIKGNAKIRQHLKLTFIGKFNYHYPEGLISVRDLLETPGALPHGIALEKMSQADVFLLLINPSGGKTMMTTKIFEYLAFKKPIFAVSIPCAATELIGENNAGYIAGWGNESEIANQILSIYDDWQNKNLKRVITDQILNKFKRRDLTRLLSQKLNDLMQY